MDFIITSNRLISFVEMSTSMVTIDTDAPPVVLIQLRYFAFARGRESIGVQLSDPNSFLKIGRIVRALQNFRSLSPPNCPYNIHCTHTRNENRITRSAVRPTPHVRDTYAMRLIFEGKHEQPNARINIINSSGGG